MAQETCDMIVLDRSYDPVAPFIHEWSYEAIAYDLLHIEGNVYKCVGSGGSLKRRGKTYIVGTRHRARGCLTRLRIPCAHGQT